MELTLHEGQQKVLDSTCRFIATSSGIQGGKTTVGAIWLLDQIWRAHELGLHGDWLISAPTLDIIRASTLKEFSPMFPKDWGVWKEGAKQYDLAFGGRIFVRSVDIPNHIEGMTLMGAWLDEAGQMDGDVWTIIQARTAIWSDKGFGKVLMTSTPYEPNWYYRDIYRQYGKDPNIDLIMWESIANPRFPKEEFERARASMPKALFERRYCGKFTRLEGLVYEDFDLDMHVVEPFDIPDHWVRFGGLDFGQSVATALVCIAEDPESHKFYVYKEFFKKGVLLREVAHFVNNAGLKFIQADAGGVGAQCIAELQRNYGCRALQNADKRVMIGIERVVELLKQNRLFFFRKRCDNTVMEMVDYHWKKQDDLKQYSKDEPVKKNDHCMDALRYAFNADRTAGSVYPQSHELRSSIKQRVRARMQRLSEDLNPWTGYRE